MRVELDIFSGRANPEWELDPAAALALEDIHGRLLPARRRPPDLPGLGYRGFRYSLGGADWRALEGLVAAASRVLADPSRSIERLLASTIPAAHAGLRPRIEKAIGQSSMPDRP